MKILFVISSLSSGGAERVMSILANYMVKHKEHKILIVTMTYDEPFYKLDDRVKIIYLNLFRKTSNIFESIVINIKRIKSFANLFRREKPNVIISFMTQTNILCILAAKATGNRIIISERISYDFYSSSLLYFVRRVTYPFCDALITQTEEDSRNYIFVKNLFTIANPIDINKVQSYIEREKIVLGVGRLDQQKGFDKLIDAFLQLKREDWKLVIIGEGVARDKLEQMIKNKGAKNIALIGKTKDVFTWYQKASIFVLSSKREGFPNVLTEAMSMGCAVVSFDCPYGPGEIIEDGVNGFLVEDQKIDKLKEAIKKLIDNKELREKLSNEAVKVKEKYSVEKIIKEWEKVVKKVVHE